MKYIIFLLITFAVYASEPSYYFEFAKNTNFIRAINTGSHTLHCWIYSNDTLKTFTVRPGGVSIYYEVDPNHERGCE